MTAAAGEIYSCDTESCLKSFDTLGKYNQHLKTHTKPWKCDICCRGFGLRGDLHRHIKARHRIGHMKFSCKVAGCDYQATRKDNIAQHVKRKHADTADDDTKGIKKHEQPSNMGTSSEVANKDNLSSRSPDQDTIEGYTHGFSTLMQAAAAGNIPILYKLIETGLDVNTKADDGYTALHCAARAGQVTAVRFLLDRGAEVNCTGTGGDRTTPAHDAVLAQCEESLVLLLRAGADIHLRARRELTLGDYIVSQNSSNLAICLLENGQLISGGDCKAKKLQMLIDAAARSGRTSVLEMLIQTNRFYDYKQWDKFWDSGPIQSASRSGYLAVVAILLPALYEARSKANQAGQICWKLSRSRDRWTSFQAAAERRHLDIVEFLLDLDKDSAHDSQDEFRGKVQFWAAERGSIEIIQIMIARGFYEANLLDRDYTGHSALSLAASQGHLPLVHFILDHSNTCSVEERTKALLAAFWAYEFDVVQALLEHELSVTEDGSQNVNIPNPQAFTMTMVAAWLVSRGAVKLFSANWVRDRDGPRSLLHLAAQRDDHQLAEYVLEQWVGTMQTRTKEFQGFIDFKTRMQRIGTQGSFRTALQLARSTRMVELLLKYGATGTSSLPPPYAPEPENGVHNEVQDSEDSESDDFEEAQDGEYTEDRAQMDDISVVGSYDSERTFQREVEAIKPYNEAGHL